MTITIKFWTKKLDDIHIETYPRQPGETAGLCGKPLLGTDYYAEGLYKNFDRSTGRPRKVCVKCAMELQKRLQEHHDKTETLKQLEHDIKNPIGDHR